MTGDTLQSFICIRAAAQLNPAPKALSNTVFLPSSLPESSPESLCPPDMPWLSPARPQTWCFAERCLR